MPRVILTITYTIKPEKRDEYLQLAKEMKDHFTAVRKKDYSIFEGKVKKNQFTEMFIHKSSPVLYQVLGIYLVMVLVLGSLSTLLVITVLVNGLARLLVWSVGGPARGGRE